MQKCKKSKHPIHRLTRSRRSHRGQVRSCWMYLGKTIIQTWELRNLRALNKINVRWVKSYQVFHLGCESPCWCGGCSCGWGVVWYGVGCGVTNGVPAHWHWKLRMKINHATSNAWIDYIIILPSVIKARLGTVSFGSGGASIVPVQTTSGGTSPVISTSSCSAIKRIKAHWICFL